MREIKCRAWDEETDEWLEDVEEFTIRALNDLNVLLEESIGIKDKHGNEIYEYDIVIPSENYSDTIRCPWLVVYEPVNFMWALHSGKYEYWRRLSLSDVNLHDGDCEVIGNIHESPELVK